MAISVSDWMMILHSGKKNIFRISFRNQRLEYLNEIFLTTFCLFVRENNKMTFLFSHAYAVVLDASSQTVSCQKTKS